MSHGRSVALVLLLLAACVVALPPAFASGPPYGIPTGVLPWEQQKYRGYHEPPPRAALPASIPARSPAQHTIRVTQLPQRHAHDDPNVAILIAHLPESAQIWFQGEPTRQRGTTRYYESPSLTPGKNYTYSVVLQWYEDGQWVSQMHSFPIHAGDVHCIDIIPSSAEEVEKEVAASLANLGPSERQAAEAQRFCAVQAGIRLGSMGTPVKAMVQDQPVFLCCKGCLERAQSNAAQTLETARKLRASRATPASP